MNSKDVDTSSPEVLVTNAHYEAQAALRAVEDATRATENVPHLGSIAYHLERLEQLVEELEEALQS